MAGNQFRIDTLIDHIKPKLKEVAEDPVGKDVLLGVARALINDRLRLGDLKPGEQEIINELTHTSQLITNLGGPPVPGGAPADPIVPGAIARGVFARPAAGPAAALNAARAASIASRAAPPHRGGARKSRARKSRARKSRKFRPSL